MNKRLFFIFFFIFYGFALNANATWVSGYYRKDGTYVSPHYRSPRGLGSGYYPRYYSAPSAPKVNISTPTYNTVYSTAQTQSSTTVATNQSAPHAPITTSQASPQSINKIWLDYYKSAAMIMGDTSNLGKVEYICQFRESEPFWESIQNKYSFCHNRGCFVEYITQSHSWSDINQKINNIYNYLKSND